MRRRCGPCATSSRRRWTGSKPERVSIVDERGRLLADGAQTDNGIAGVGIEERQIGIEKRMQLQIEDIVASIVGGRARVQVSAALGQQPDREPFGDLRPREPGRSLQPEPQSRAPTTSRGRGGPVTVGNELPGARRARAPRREQGRLARRTRKWSITRSPHHPHRGAGGRPRSSSFRSPCWSTAPTPHAAKGDVHLRRRSDEELERIRQLVRSASASTKPRGDKIEVVNLRFAEGRRRGRSGRAEPMQPGLFDFTKRGPGHGFADAGVDLALTLIVLMVVVRPLLKQVPGTRGVPRRCRPSCAMA